MQYHLRASNLETGSPQFGAPIMRVRRGPDDWNYIRTELAFFIALETVILAIPNSFPYSSVILFLAVAAVTRWAFTNSGWVHNKLIGRRIRDESQFR